MRFDRARPVSQDDLQDLARTCRDNPPPTPADSEWKRVLSGIEEELRTHRQAHSYRRWGKPVLMAVGAVFLLIALAPMVKRENLPLSSTSREQGLVTLDDQEDVFPVANLNDVNIIRMDPRDAEQIAAGRNIFTSLVLASRSEIALHHTERGSGASIGSSGEVGPIFPEMQSEDGKESKP